MIFNYIFKRNVKIYFFFEFWDFKEEFKYDLNFFKWGIMWFLENYKMVFIRFKINLCK